ncbi:hypothetical protein [Parasporobacterium paucivorans]|uniref:Tfp pilus assembly protein PilN n=1 Tax=Parasporobacterium paucivorans DSM 15970 TaxID=1122934 RepID=A0A1M6IR25_9FIRM|nr:hypothetical protein [Parasporobacterium paucivorans]SHJ36838.1 hypothetical protein SAMN02745691_01827 [Parasporobacterium paucivorans DSM 15970]
MRDYNFFEVFESKKGVKLNPRSPFFIAAVIIAVCVVLSLGLVVRNWILTKNIDSATEELAKTKTSQEYILANELQNSMDAMTEYEKSADTTLEKFTSADIIGSQLMTDIFKGLPSNAVVIFFNLEGLDLKMTCDVPNRETAAELLLGLKQTELMQTVKLDTIETKQDNTGLVVRVYGVLKAGEAE